MSVMEVSFKAWDSRKLKEYIFSFFCKTSFYCILYWKIGVNYKTVCARHKIIVIISHREFLLSTMILIEGSTP